MRYEIRHISLWSTLRFGLLAGALLGALPGLCLGTLAVQVLQQIAQLLERMQNVNVQPPPISTGFGDIPLPNIALNLVTTLGLTGAADRVNTLGASSAFVFLLMFIGSIIASGLLVVLPMLMFSLVYNGLAPFAGGFRVDLVERERQM